MNYKVLYRKYRPNEFENVIGQNYIIETLKNSIINRNISHAYIFSGPRGTGKTSTAKIFAKAINCLNPQDGSPCGKCEFCKNFAENPDIIEIDAASNNGVDQIRELIDNIKLSPSNGKFKVYIIDEVHMLTTSAFNALLLTLEEPPSHVVFILATTNIENVPITILSRCQRFDFKKIFPEEIFDLLKKVCKKEKISAEDDALKEIAYLADGGVRDALSLLDQLSKLNKKLSLKLVENEIKIISQTTIDELIEIVEKSELEKFMNLIDEFKKRAIDYKTFIKKTIDSLSIKAKNIKLTSKIERLTFEDYKNLIFDLSECIMKININIDPYTILELTFLKYFNEKKEVSMPNLEEKAIVIKKDETKIEKLIELRINNCFVNAKKEYLEEEKANLKKLIENNKIKGKIRAIFIDSEVVAASDTNLILTYLNDHQVKNANDFLDEIEECFNKYLNKKIKPIFITKDRWNVEKNNYIKNLNKKIKYVMMDEPEKNGDKIIVDDVFNKDKVEII